LPAVDPGFQPGGKKRVLAKVCRDFTAAKSRIVLGRGNKAKPDLTPPNRVLNQSPVTMSTVAAGILACRGAGLPARRKKRVLAKVCRDFTAAEISTPFPRVRNATIHGSQEYVTPRF